VSGISAEVDIDAEMSAAWLLPANIQKVSVEDVSVILEVSGRKNDPNCWVPISSTTLIGDFDMIVESKL